MKNAVRKLFAAGTALVLSVVMMVTISYAWSTLSTAPIAEGIQISIGGGNTILIAPNLSKTVDGVTYCYPGWFRDTLNFMQHEQYDYLRDLQALSPVSTADGVSWFIPEYYGLFDKEVQNGDACVGDLKPLSSFLRDTSLQYANLTGVKDAKGHYLYLDFWVVSPGSDYTLRVSTGDENGGSFLLELKEPVQNSDGKYTLQDTSGIVSASARVGFLVNPDYVDDTTLFYYQQSYSYEDRYPMLRGTYGSVGQEWYSENYRFSIYEPNGDLHPNGVNGTYLVTSPVGMDGDRIIAANVQDNLSVQLRNSWKETGSSGLGLDEIFQTAIHGKQFTSPSAVKNEVYFKYLQGQFAAYVNKGSFVKSTAALYTHNVSGNIVTEEEMSEVALGGATEDTYIVSLEKNVPQRIRMFVWIEGQDPDCATVASLSDFALSIELAGSH